MNEKINTVMFSILILKTIARDRCASNATFRSTFGHFLKKMNRSNRASFVDIFFLKINRVCYRICLIYFFFYINAFFNCAKKVDAEVHTLVV
jgi:hypothetical protein